MDKKKTPIKNCVLFPSRFYISKYWVKKSEAKVNTYISNFLDFSATLSDDTTGQTLMDQQT